MIIVSETGEVDEIVLRQSLPGFDLVALETVGKWRYAPVHVEGNETPTSWRSTVTLRFKLR